MITHGTKPKTELPAGQESVPRNFYENTKIILLIGGTTYCLGTNAVELHVASLISKVHKVEIQKATLRPVSLTVSHKMDQGFLAGKRCQAEKHDLFAER